MSSESTRISPSRARSRAMANARRQHRCVVALLAGLLFTCALLAPALALSRRKEIDFDALEKAWEADDAARELRSEADEQFDRLSAKSQEEAKAVGPQMVFVTLRTDEPLGGLASRWKEMLWNGGVDVNIYEIEAAKVLVGLQKGMFMPELRAFLAGQKEVVSYDWDSKTYRRNGSSREANARTKQPKATDNKKKKNSKEKKKKSAGDSDGRDSRITHEHEL